MRKKKRLLIGFDGFIDSLLHCVAKRTSPQSFIPISKIVDFASIVKKAATKNANVECVSLLQDLGGNAPILARALSSLKHHVTLAGCCGYPTIHPLFTELKKKCQALHSIANPGLTDALEFSDGKLFLGKMNELGTLSLETMLERCPIILSAVSEASCIATVNWTMMPLVDEFWRYLLEHPKLLKHSPILFIDLANPAKRPIKDLKESLSLLTILNQSTPVILGLNLSESEQVGALFHMPHKKSLELTAEALRKKLSLSAILIHSSKKAAISSQKERVSLIVPWTDHPFRTTGAGDTFNAGFLSALIQEKSMKECLQHAIAASGTFVRTGISPTPKAIKLFYKKFFI